MRELRWLAAGWLLPCFAACGGIGAASEEPGTEVRPGGAAGVDGSATTPDVAAPPPVGGADGAAPVPRDDGGACVLHASTALVEHACLHARKGPYRDVVATAEGPPVAVNRPHTSYRIDLAAEGSEYVGLVAYEPTRAGDHAFFLGPAGSVTVVSPPARGTLLDHGTACAELPRAIGFRLPLAAHVLRLRSPSPRVELVVEVMEGDEDAYDARCTGADGGVEGGADGS